MFSSFTPSCSHTRFIRKYSYINSSLPLVARINWFSHRSVFKRGSGAPPPHIPHERVTQSEDFYWWKCPEVVMSPHWCLSTVLLLVSGISSSRLLPGFGSHLREERCKFHINNSVRDPTAWSINWFCYWASSHTAPPHTTPQNYKYNNWLIIIRLDKSHCHHITYYTSI